MQDHNDFDDDINTLLLLAYAREFSIEEMREHLRDLEEILSGSERLRQIAGGLTANQFEKCSELDQELLEAIIALEDVQPTVCRRGISSIAIRNTLKRTLLYCFDLRESLLQSDV
jgi:hypothetical protein